MIVLLCIADTKHNLSLIDTYWTPQTDGCQYILPEILTSKIRYNLESITWKAVGKGV